MKKIYQDIDLRSNYIKNSKVETHPSNENNETIANHEYVNEVDKYNSSLTQNTSLEPQPIGGITTREQLHDKPTNEILDQLFYPRVLHDYIKPTIAINGHSISPNTYEVGKSVSINPSISINLKDSSGFKDSGAYELKVFDVYKGSVIDSDFVGQYHISEDTPITQINDVVLKENMSLFAKVNYKRANVLNDSLGDIDLIGTTNNPFYEDGYTISSARHFKAYWGYYLSVIDETYSMTPEEIESALNTDSNELKTIFETFKTVGEKPTSFNLDIDGDGKQKHVYIIVPYDNSLPSISVTKDGSFSITASFERKDLGFINDIENSGLQKKYAMFYHNNGVGYQKDSTYSIQITY